MFLTPLSFSGSRSFTASAVSYRLPAVGEFRYWKGLDWDRITRLNNYAIVDPVDPTQPLYLTEREYKTLLRTALSTETSILVIARAGEEKPSDWETKAKADLTKISPPNIKTITKGSWWRSGVRRIKSLLVKDSMVVPDERNFISLVRRYGYNLSAYTGLTFSPALYLAVSAFGLQCVRTLQNNGVDSLIMKLKVTLLAVHMYLAGKPCSTRDVGYPIAQSRDGLPLWLPPVVRNSIRQRNIKWIRYWTSLLNMYRNLKGTYKKGPNYSTITAPQVRIPPDWDTFIKVFIKRHIKITWKPEDLRPQRFPLLISASGVGTGPSILSSWKAAVLWTLQPENHLVNYLSHVEDKKGLTMFSLMVHRAVLWWGQILFEARGGTNKSPNQVLCLGALHPKYEPAGKIRIFAMVDYWTQYALLPLHKILFDILRQFPSDATFDQEAGVNTFTGAPEYYSFDLSSATDMMSINLYIPVLNELFGAGFGDLWAKLLVDRDYRLPKDFPVYDGKGTIRYTRGQPMGALSSWASMALIHHLIVQYAATSMSPEPDEVFGPGNQIYSGYRLLGDDLVIRDGIVARRYLQLCERFSVPIGLFKSPQSPPTEMKGRKGFRLYTFANQAVLGDFNITGVSLREEITASTLQRRIEFVDRLRRRGWAEHLRERTLTWVMRSLSPLQWARMHHLLRKGEISPFFKTLLPVLLNPSMKVEVGLSGLAKLWAWFLACKGTYRFADLFNQRPWDSIQDDFYSHLAEYAETRFNSLVKRWASKEIQGIYPELQRWASSPPVRVALSGAPKETPLGDVFSSEGVRFLRLKEVPLKVGLRKPKMSDWVEPSFENLPNLDPDAPLQSGASGLRNWKIFKEQAYRDSFGKSWLVLPVLEEAVRHYLESIEAVFKTLRGSYLDHPPYWGHAGKVNLLFAPYDRRTTRLYEDTTEGTYWGLGQENEILSELPDPQPWQADTPLFTVRLPPTYLSATIERLDIVESLLGLATIDLKKILTPVHDAPPTFRLRGPVANLWKLIGAWRPPRQLPFPHVEENLHLVALRVW